MRTSLRRQFPFKPLVFGRRSDTGDAVELEADELVRHLAVFGTTGSGKTSLFLALMLQLMDRGRGFIFCTTKHDPTMPRALAWAAAERQQLWRLRVFDPAHPVHVYNPTATTNPTALARLYFSQLPPIEPTSEARHYHDVQLEFLLLACTAIMATGLRHVPNDILQLARNYEIAAPKLRQRLQALGKEDHMADLDGFFRRFYRRGEFQANEAQEALSGLTSVLQGLDVGRFAGLLSQPFSEVDLLQACRRGLWAYMGLPASMDADGGQLGRLFLTDLIMAIDEIQRAEAELVHAPFVIVLDEFPSYALPQFARVFEQARSSGIGILLGAQTVSGLSDRAAGLSEGFRDRVLGNCAHIVSFRLGPGEGAEYFSKFTGKADRAIVQVSETESRGRTWSPLAPSSWIGWTHRTDGRSSFSGYRVQKDLVMESRHLTHELALRGQAIWLSPKAEATLPFVFWSLWAEASAAPAGWDYASHCAKWDRTPAPPLELGRYVRLINIRRSAAQSQAAPGPHPTGALTRPIPAATPSAVAQPATGTPPPTPEPTAPQGAPAQGRRKRRATPKPTSLISYVSPRSRQPSDSEIARHPSAPSPLPAQPAPAKGSQPEFTGPDAAERLDAPVIDKSHDEDDDGVTG